MATDLTVPNAFAANTLAESGKVNENFDAVKTLVNVTGVPKVQDGIVTQQGLAADAKIPAGAMMDFAGPNAPTGWLLCDGSIVSRAAYPDLFAAIGTNWGAGDGSTTFALPDLRGRVGVGLDNMDNSVGTGGGDAGRLSVANTLGSGSGAETHTLVEGEMPAHTHGDGTLATASVVQPRASGFQSNAYNEYSAAPGLTAVDGWDGGAAIDVTGSTGSKGGGGAHNNMQPYALVTKIVKV